MAIPDLTGFLGLRGSGDWSTDERPTSYRESILFQNPNGDTPLTGLLSKTASETVDDPQFTWWEENLARQAGAVTGVYSDVSLSTAITTSDATAADATIYVKMAAATVKHFRPGHTAMLRLSTNSFRKWHGRIVGRVENGASSYVAFKIYEADGAAVTNVSTADFIQVIGNVNAEGSQAPSSISYDPVKYTNYTQIFRTPLEITGTAEATTLRTEQTYKKLKRQALLYHGLELEKALLYNGAAREGIGANGKPERETAGLLHWIETYASDNVDNYLTTSYWTGAKTWATGGKEWLDSKLQGIFKYGTSSKLAICGVGAIGGINALAEQYGTVNISPGQKVYGINIREWMTPYGSLNLLIHPLFSSLGQDTNSMVIIDPKMIMARPLKGRDTKFLKDREENEIDGKKEEFLTEVGYEYHHPEGWGYLSGVGENKAS